MKKNGFRYGPPAHVAEDRIKIGGPPEELFLAQASVTNIYIYIPRQLEPPGYVQTKLAPLRFAS